MTFDDVLSTILVMVFGAMFYLAGKGDMLNLIPLMLHDRAEQLTRITCATCKHNVDGECWHPKNQIQTYVPELGEYCTVQREPKVDDDHYCGYAEKRSGDE